MELMEMMTRFEFGKEYAPEWFVDMYNDKQIDLVYSSGRVVGCYIKTTNLEFRFGDVITLNDI